MRDCRAHGNHSTSSAQGELICFVFVVVVVAFFFVDKNSYHSPKTPGPTLPRSHPEDPFAKPMATKSEASEATTTATNAGHKLWTLFLFFFRFFYR